MKRKLIKFIEKNQGKHHEVPENNANLNDIINFTIITPSGSKYQGDYETPLLSALIKKGEYDLASELIKTPGVNLNSQDSKHQTPLDYAIESRNITLSAELIRTGANTNYIIGREDEDESQKFTITETIANVIALDKISFANKLLTLFGTEPTEGGEDAKNVLLNIWLKFNGGSGNDKKEINDILSEAREREYSEWEQQQLESRSDNNSSIQHNIDEEEVDLLAGGPIDHSE